MAGGGATVTDPETGESIEIEQLNPSDQCYDEFRQWVEENTKEGGLVSQKLEEKCPSTAVSYTLERKCHYTDSGGGENNDCVSYFSDAEYYVIGSGGLYEGGDDWQRYWTELTLRRTESTPSDATGVIFCRTVTKGISTVAYEDYDLYDINCSPNKDTTTSIDKFTIKFDDTVEIKINSNHSCSCNCTEKETGDSIGCICWSTDFENWSLRAIQYSYD